MWNRTLGGHDRSGAFHDLGLQAERTAMAWERTTLGFAGVCALLLHDSGGRVWTKVPALAGLAAALVLLVLTQIRYEQTVRRLASGRATGAVGPVLALSSAVTLLAAVSIGVIIFQGGS